MQLTDDEIDTICEQIWEFPNMHSTSSGDVQISAHDGESHRSFVKFGCGNYSLDRINADIFGTQMRQHNDNHVLLIPLGSRAFIVSNDLLRKVFCQ